MIQIGVVLMIEYKWILLDLNHEVIFGVIIWLAKKKSSDPVYLSSLASVHVSTIYEGGKSIYLHLA